MREGSPDVLVVHERPESRPDLTQALREAGCAVAAIAPDEELERRLRDAQEAAIVVGVGPEDERVPALMGGCDLFLPDTAGPEEVVVTVRAALRLLRRLGDHGREAAYDDGLVRIDAALRHVEVAGRPVQLTPLEFRLLMALVRGRDRVVSRAELMEATWQRSGPADGDHVKLYVHYLRRKLNEHAGRELIQTVRGFGYRWLGARAHERMEPTGRFRQRRRAAR